MKDAAKRAPQTAEKGTSATSERPLTIGQVVAQLLPDFPDLSITKIRYLEDRKLLSPARSKGRYRKYNTADVRLLRSILTLQRDEYLPLEVIRQRVDRAATSATGQALTSAVASLRSNLDSQTGRAALHVGRAQPAGRSGRRLLADTGGVQADRAVRPDRSDLHRHRSGDCTHLSPSRAFWGGAQESEAAQFLGRARGGYPGASGGAGPALDSRRQTRARPEGPWGPGSAVLPVDALPPLQGATQGPVALRCDLRVSTTCGSPFGASRRTMTVRGTS